MGETAITVPELAGLEPIHGTDENGYPFFSCTLAAALPGADYWYAYIHKNANLETAPQDHYVLHSPEVHPRSMLYCRVETYGAKRGRLCISPGAHYLPVEHELPGLTTERPICREEITVNPERGADAVAKDIARRLLPGAIEFWKQSDSYADRKAKTWWGFVDVVNEVCSMAGVKPPEERRLAKGFPWPGNYQRNVGKDWHLEVRGTGSYELTKHGEIADLFDTLNLIGWGAKDE